MQINVNVTVDGADGIGLNTEIRETQTWDDESEEYVKNPVTLGDAVAGKLTAMLVKDERYASLRKRFLEIREEEIRRAVQPIVIDAINAPVQKTNTFGEATGGTTTVRELIVAEAKKIAERPFDTSYNSRSGNETALGKFVREQIAAAFTKELAAVVAAEKAKVVAAVRAKAADLIADAVKQGVGR